MSLSQAESGSSKSYDLGTVDKLTQLLKCRFPAGLSSRNISLSDLLQQLRLEPAVKDAAKAHQMSTQKHHTKSSGPYKFTNRSDDCVWEVDRI